MKHSSKRIFLIHTFFTPATPASKKFKRKLDTGRDTNESNESNDSKENVCGDLEKMDLLDLQFLLESHGASKSGDKPILISRIKELFGLNEYDQNQDVGEGEGEHVIQDFRLLP